MKILVGLGLAILAVAPVEVIAAPKSVSETCPISVKSWRRHPSQGCHTYNRSAQVAPEALPMPEPQALSDKFVSRVCFLHFHGCYQVKRPVKNASRIPDIYDVINGLTDTEIGKSGDKRTAEIHNPSRSMFHCYHWACPQEKYPQTKN